MRELITLQIGQCGNQIGHEFWKNLATEHGVEDLSQNKINEEKEQIENKEVFFYQVNDDRYIPRVILLDLEPRVINEISTSTGKNLYNPENILKSSNDGGGAGNNWAKGYICGKNLHDAVFDMISREAEACNNLEGFQLIHGIAGGTGSGLGSYTLENLSDLYPKKVIQTYSVFPNDDKISDVVVQPYNSVLTCHRLYNYADSVILIDNVALTSLVMERFKVGSPTFAQANHIVSDMMIGCTATLRYPIYSHGTLSSLISTIQPLPRCNFLTTSIGGYLYEGNMLHTPKTSLYEALRRAQLPKNQLIKMPSNSQYLASLSIVRGDELNDSEIYKAMRRLSETSIIRFPPWVSGGMQITHAGESKYLEKPKKIRVCSLSNHTGITNLLKRIVNQYDLLRNREAFLEQYKKTGLFTEDLSELAEAKESVLELINEYEMVKSENYVRKFIK